MYYNHGSPYYTVLVDSQSLPSDDMERIKELVEASEHMFKIAEGITPEDKFEGVDVSALESSFVVVSTCYTEAVRVFKFAQEQIVVAHGFYQLNGYVTDHIEVVQDASTLYNLLSMFETDLELKCRMHKRRIDMLEELSNSLNTQHYMMLCRQMWYEIGEFICSYNAPSLSEKNSCEFAKN